ncbi:hypothetical protein ACN38_g4915 [Penicillium nordicum]|uniref:Uncharacterized protein n=1 Tax=Penicillium nordicum TaxID=229535 RepID=A0A0M9WGP3_9EURO|nr:hypothetical protein ACN38_g4915 [Penicillium nordicum]
MSTITKGHILGLTLAKSSCLTLAPGTFMGLLRDGGDGGDCDDCGDRAGDQNVPGVSAFTSLNSESWLCSLTLSLTLSLLLS